jgi:uncharacterized membrane protein
MVEDYTFLNDALKQAEAKTSAKISVVISPISDSYQDYILAYGLILGTMLTMTLWAFGLDFAAADFVGRHAGKIAQQTRCQLFA